jgi:hypothetical protein
MGKGKKYDLDEIIKMESEFKIYFRPIIEEDADGWGFLAENLKIGSSAVYPKIFDIRQTVKTRE